MGEDECYAFLCRSNNIHQGAGASFLRLRNSDKNMTIRHVLKAIRLDKNHILY